MSDLTAEEFIRKKIRDKFELKGEMNGLWTYGLNGEDALRWAHEYAEIKMNGVENKDSGYEYCECEKPTLGKSISRCGTCDEWFKPI